MKEPALDPDAGHAAPNELVLTFYDDQHLDVLATPRCAGRWHQLGRSCPDSYVGAIRKAPARKWDSGRRSASTRAARSCRAVLTLTCGLAARRHAGFSSVVSALSCGHHALSGLTEHVATSGRAKTWPRQTPRCAGPNKDTERIASHEGPIVLPVLTQYIAKRSAFNRII